jgi:hypothetical protein
MIYIIEEWLTKNVKIGYSSDPDERLKQMQTGNSNELELLHGFKCGQAAEKHFHKIFKPFLIRGEWYDKRAYEFFFVGTKCVEDLYDNFSDFEDYVNGHNPSYSVTILERIIGVL